MAQITCPYVAVTGNNFTAAIFNGLWPSLTCTIQTGEVVNSMIASGAVDKTKIAANVAGAGMQQNSDGSLSPTNNSGLNNVTLAGSNVNLTPGTDVTLQFYSGTVSAAITISALTALAVTNQQYWLRFKGVVITAVNTLTIQNGSTPLVAFTDAGTLDGLLILVFDGTNWQILMNHVTLRP